MSLRSCARDRLQQASVRAMHLTKVTKGLRSNEAEAKPRKHEQSGDKGQPSAAEALPALCQRAACEVP